MLAALSQTPELALATDEAERLARALRDVTRHYQVPAVKPAHMALAVLIWTAGSIYVPKAVAIKARFDRPVSVEMPATNAPPPFMPEPVGSAVSAADWNFSGNA